MTNEEKQLLLKDLCARLPYGVIISYYNVYEKSSIDAEVSGYSNGFIEIQNHSLNPEYIKPYLRPMGSMTDEECCEFDEMFDFPLEAAYNTVTKETIIYNSIVIDEGYSVEIGIDDIALMLDWLNEHHFDYRGLIEKGLALKAPEDMYKTRSL